MITVTDIATSRAKGRLSIGKEFTFEAAHRLPLHKGKCAHLHGHSWKLYVEVSGYIHSESGFVCDFGDLKVLVCKHIIDVVDHQWLGYGDADVSAGPNQPKGSFLAIPGVLGPDFYPTSENLIITFSRILKPLIPTLSPAWQELRLETLILSETCTSATTWRNNDPL